MFKKKELKRAYWLDFMQDKSKHNFQYILLVNLSTDLMFTNVVTFLCILTGYPFFFKYEKVL